MTHTQDDAYVEKLNLAIKNLYVEIKLKHKDQHKENNQIPKELDKIKDIKSLELIGYIKESIEIYTNLKIKEHEKIKKNEEDDEKALEAYETIIKQLEADKRNHIKVN